MAEITVTVPAVHLIEWLISYERSTWTGMLSALLLNASDWSIHSIEGDSDSKYVTIRLFNNDYDEWMKAKWRDTATRLRVGRSHVI